MLQRHNVSEQRNGNDESAVQSIVQQRTTNIETCVSPYRAKRELFRPEMREATVDETAGVGIDVHMFQPGNTVETTLFQSDESAVRAMIGDFFHPRGASRCFRSASVKRSPSAGSSFRMPETRVFFRFCSSIIFSSTVPWVIHL